MNKLLGRLPDTAVAAGERMPAAFDWSKQLARGDRISGRGLLSGIRAVGEALGVPFQ